MSDSKTGVETTRVKDVKKKVEDPSNTKDATEGTSKDSPTKNGIADEPLDEKTKEKIRRGCILLQDAYAGRASHGLFSLLDGPAWKRGLFIIHTHSYWGTTVITASICHALLIAWEPPNYQCSWVDHTLDPMPVRVAEMLCISVFIADIAMKMLYFGGWQDYVSKEWQRNYGTIIALFILDFILYHAGICPLRFSRPLRLTVLAARHRDVRRLISFLPTMCHKLLTTFALPMLGVLAFFGILCVRIYGRLPEGQRPDLGDDSFEHLLPAMRTLFMLSTLDNFDPVVIQTFKLHPLSFFFFLVFIMFASFFLMSVALGVMFDLYIEDHEITVKNEAKKEEKSSAKAFKQLDVEKQGRIRWPHFREMMYNLRPHDKVESHAMAIFKELTQKFKPEEEPYIDIGTFREIGGLLNVYFVKLKADAKPRSHRLYQTFEKNLLIVDVVFLLTGIDRFLIYEIAPYKLDVGALMVVAAVIPLLFAVGSDWAYAKRLWSMHFRKLDFAILLISLVGQGWLFACALPAIFAWQRDSLECSQAFRSFLSALGALRIIRPVLHHEASRFYLSCVLQVAPVLVHFGGLVATFNYMFAIIAIEMLARPPQTESTPEGLRLQLECDNALPNFNCVSTGLLSIFMVFIQANWGNVLHVREADKGLPPLPWEQSAGISIYFIVVYAVMGIGLCNLLTTLVVEFHKVLEQDSQARVIEKAERRRQISQKLKAIMANVRMFKSTRKRIEDLMSAVPETEQPREVMMGRHYGGWRKRLATKEKEKTA